MAKRETMNTRREFLTRGVMLAAAAGTVPSFLDRAALALDNPQANEAPRAGDDQPVLVVIQLGGGNDYLNTVVPYTDDAYYEARPALGIPAAEVLRIDETRGFHPAMTPMKALWDEGRLGVVQAVGYPNPNRSHFRAMEIWETAVDSDVYTRYGWLGRFFDNACQGAPDDAFVGLSIGRQMPQAFANTSSVGISLQRPEQYRWLGTNRRDPEQEAAVYAALNGATPGADRPLDFLQRVSLNASLSSARILELAARRRDTVEYPESNLAGDLRIIAQMIAGGLPSRVYYASQTGYDTHAQQDDQHGPLLADFSAALKAFCDDLAGQGNLERVMVVAFSEFGRRVRENGSRGTDHGYGGVMFVAGGAVTPGWHGQAPSLTDLDRGDLKHHVDFRAVYAGILRDWLKTDAAAVLGGEFGGVSVVKA